MLVPVVFQLFHLMLLLITLASANHAVGFGGFELRSEPVFVGEVQNVTVAKGRDAVLTCNVKHLGPYKVVWIKADSQTILTLHKRRITTNRRVLVSHDQQHAWSLHVRDVRPTDAGCYMCQINTIIMKNQYGCITVRVPPMFDSAATSRDVSVTAGCNVTLSCYAHGDPPPTISWRREDGLPLIPNSTNAPRKIERYEGERLELVHVTRHHAGAYLCIARNDVPPTISKRILVNVAFAPVVRVAHSWLGVLPAASVTIDCQIEASPPLQTHWQHAGEKITNDGSKYVIQVMSRGTKTHVALQINDFKRGDDGRYTCSASNTISSAAAHVQLREVHPSRFTTPVAPARQGTPRPRRPETTLHWHRHRTPPPPPLVELPGEHQRLETEPTSQRTPPRRSNRPPESAITSGAGWRQPGVTVVLLVVLTFQPSLLVN